MTASEIMRTMLAAAENPAEWDIPVLLRVGADEIKCLMERVETVKEKRRYDRERRLARPAAEPWKGKNKWRGRYRG